MLDEKMIRGGRLKRTQKQPEEPDFQQSHALVIGINDYGNGIRPLTTPVNDATRLAAVLTEQLQTLEDQDDQTQMDDGTGGIAGAP